MKCGRGGVSNDQYGMIGICDGCVRVIVLGE